MHLSNTLLVDLTEFDVVDPFSSFVNGKPRDLDDVELFSSTVYGPSSSEDLNTPWFATGDGGIVTGCVRLVCSEV